MTDPRIEELYKFVKDRKRQLTQEEHDKCQSMYDEIIKDEKIDKKTKEIIAKDIQSILFVNSDQVKKMTDILKNEFEKFEQDTPKKAKSVKKQPETEEIKPDEFEKEICEVEGKSVTDIGEIDNIEQYIEMEKSELKKVIEEKFPFSEDMKQNERRRITRKRAAFRKKLKELKADANKGVEIKEKKLKKESEESEQLPSDDFDATVKAIMEIDEEKKWSEKTLNSMTKMELVNLLNMLSEASERLTNDAVEAADEALLSAASGLETLSKYTRNRTGIDLEGYRQKLESKNEKIKLIIAELVEEYPGLKKLFPAWARLSYLMLGTGIEVAGKNKINQIFNVQPPLPEKKSQVMNSGGNTGTGQ